jgi:hypothetical protein
MSMLDKSEAISMVQAIAMMVRLIHKTEGAAMNDILHQACCKILLKAEKELQQEERLHPPEEKAEDHRGDSRLWRRLDRPRQNLELMDDEAPW